jgi:predicted O-methyltransferase YrrM
VTVPADPAAYAESWLPEDHALASARARAEEVGVLAVPALTGALLSFLAASVGQFGTAGARSVAEVGTGTGVSGLWIVRGMHPEGILTSIDVEGEHLRLAKEAFADAGLTGRVRLIAGRALQVLPRLADGAYDMVHLDAGLVETPDLLPEALRALRIGGILAVSRALAGGRVVDPAARDSAAVAMREVGQALRSDERLIPVLLPVGDGLAAAVRLS